MGIDSLMLTMPKSQVQHIMDGALLVTEITVLAIALIMWWWLWRNR